MTTPSNRPNYLAIWIWLLGLTLFCVGLSLIPGVPRLPVVVVFFIVAALKASLVVLNYMHLRYEKVLLYAIAIVPVVIVIILLFALFPDFVTHGKQLHSAH